MMCPYLLISINELLISIIPFIDINKYGLNVKTAAHKHLGQGEDKVIDIINTVRQMKWFWAGYINTLKDDRWTSRVTTWRPYDKKRQGRPAKRWRDDTGQILERHDMTEDRTRQGNLETAC